MVKNHGSEKHSKNKKAKGTFVQLNSLTTKLDETIALLFSNNFH